VRHSIHRKKNNIHPRSFVVVVVERTLVVVVGSTHLVVVGDLADNNHLVVVEDLVDIRKTFRLIR
jgi:hypothetical protein